MEPYVPGQCLFCPSTLSSFEESVTHMRKSHGFFVPHEGRLAVDLETLFKYMHLVIYGYRECIHCGTARTTVQAVQQHMTGKGHCRFDVAEEDSEFAEFYDFVSDMDMDTTEGEEEEEEEEEEEGEVDGATHREEQTAARPSNQKKPVLADEDSIRLPSGKIISRHSASIPGGSSSSSLLSSNGFRRRILRDTSSSQLEYTSEQNSQSQSHPQSQSQSNAPPNTESNNTDTRLLSKREKREKANITYQLANLSANDRTSLMHLPAAQQRAVLLTQQRQEERIQKAERRRQGKIDRKGNKNLYAYWHTETPVYQCG